MACCEFELLCITGVLLPWRVGTLPWLTGWVVLGYALAGTTIALVVRLLGEPTVEPIRRVITSGCMRARRVLAGPRVVCVRRKSIPRCDRGIHFAV